MDDERIADIFAKFAAEIPYDGTQIGEIMDTTSPTPAQKFKPGYLLWSSFKNGEFNPAELVLSAHDAGITQKLYSRIRSRNDKNAWMVSTQFGKGLSSTTMEHEDGAYYFTEDMPGLSTTRVIARASKNSSEIEFRTTQVAMVILEGSGQLRIGIERNFQGSVTPEIYEEAMEILEDVRTNMALLAPTMSAGAVREMLRRWIYQNKCVPLKNNSGVYFLPLPIKSTDQKIQEEELMSLIKWFRSYPLNGQFIVVEVSSEDSIFNDLSLNQVAEDSMKHLIDTFNTLNNNVKKYENSTGQIRPTSIRKVHGAVKDFKDQATLLKYQLSIDITNIMIGAENLIARLDTVLSTSGE